MQESKCCICQVHMTEIVLFLSTQMDGELERYHKTNSGLDLLISNLKLKQTGLGGEVLLQRRSRCDLEGLIKRMQYDIQQVRVCVFVCVCEFFLWLCVHVCVLATACCSHVFANSWLSAFDPQPLCLYSFSFLSASQCVYHCPLCAAGCWFYPRAQGPEGEDKAAVPQVLR